MLHLILKWLKQPIAKLSTTAVIAGMWVAFLLLLHFLLPVRLFESKYIAPLLFQAREAMHRAPHLHPSIKAYGLDDFTTTMLGSSELTLDEWAATLKAISVRKPRAIIIDALFSLTKGDKYPEALATLRNISTPIYTGAFVSKTEFADRRLVFHNVQYDLKHYSPKSPLSPGADEDPLARFSRDDSGEYFVYGPHASLYATFNKPGHLLYGTEEGNFKPFLNLGQGKVLPHIMMMPFDDVVINGDRVTVEGAEFTMAEDGSVPINFSSLDTFQTHVRSFSELAFEKYRPTFIDRIEPGDFVYIIPMYFTGNADFKTSPIGQISGAFSHLAVLNSILQKDTLRLVEIAPTLIFGFALLVASMGRILSPVRLIYLLIGSTALWIGTCIGSFVFKGVILPLLLPQLSIVGVGITVLLERIYLSEQKARMIRQALEGIIRPEALRALQKNPEKLSLDARERVITVLFIDIVGFSLMVENQQPRLAFEGLQRLIESISLCIHKHGGIVNKTLGDGLLCFFGYSFEDNEGTANHAEEALAAAVEIQRSNLPNILAASGNRNPVFPLRIGINTAPVFMGNLGAGERVDFTVIGHGVNFAKRLESACLPHSVLIGPTTHELLSDRTDFGAVTRRLIAIKHREDMVEAWEYDPIDSTPELRRRANEIYEASSSLHRMERRWAANASHRVAVETEHGQGALMSYSPAGLSFSLPVKAVVGGILAIQIDSADGSLHRQLEAQGLQKMRVEVRWIQGSPGAFVHGVRFVDLEIGQSDRLLEVLCRYVPKQEDLSLTAS